MQRSCCTRPAARDRKNDVEVWLEISLVADSQREARCVWEAGWLTDDVPAGFALDAAFFADEVLEAAAEVQAAARVGVGIGSVVEQLTHEIEPCACGCERH